MSSRRSNPALGVLAILGAPYLVGYLWPIIGMCLMVIAAIAMAVLVSRAKRAGTQPSGGVSFLLVWCFVLTLLGFVKSLNEAREKRDASKLREQEVASAEALRDEQQRKKLAAESEQRAQRLAEEREREVALAVAVSEDTASPWVVRVARAASVLDRRILEPYICHARELLAVAPDAKSAKALQRQIDGATRSVERERKTTYRTAVAEARRESRANGMLECDDGSHSGCDCDGSWQGCCSHHGGVSHCDYPEPAYVQSRSLRVDCNDDVRRAYFAAAREARKPGAGPATVR